MKTARGAVMAAILLTTLNAFAQSPAKKAFELMKSLSGNWEGKDQMGDPVQVSFRMTAGGTTLMSEITSQMAGKQEDMISMIHMDGDRLLLTHYCPSGNQPRMKASLSPDGKSVTFDFVDATNLETPDTGHMHSVVFTIIDSNHHTEEWHYRTGRKESVEKFDLQKKG